MQTPNTFTLHPTLATDTIELGRLPVCRVLLMNDSQFPWIILVPERADIRELYQLNSTDLTRVQNESLMICKLMMSHFRGDKLNTGALGNLVPQLHLHHIVRFTDDPVWPKPVWGQLPPKPFSVKQLDIQTNTLKQLIAKNSSAFIAC